MEQMTTKPFTRIQNEEPRVGRRPTPIKMMTVTATAPGAAQTLITAPEKRALEVMSLMISNITPADVVFNLYAVPFGGSVSDATALIKGAVIKANASDDLIKFIDRFYEQGTSLRVYCGVSNAVKMKGWAEEIF
ncbi:MAG: hypothetical protein ACRCXM_04580 [Beijerinckiaceae bacterium]